MARLKISDPKLRARPTVETAARACGLSYGEVMSRCRAAQLVEARHIAMLALHRAGWSYPQIARGLGRSNHTTAIHGVRVAEGREADDPGFAAALSIAERVTRKEI